MRLLRLSLRDSRALTWPRGGRRRGDNDGEEGGDASFGGSCGAGVGSADGGLAGNEGDATRAIAAKAVAAFTKAIGGALMRSETAKTVAAVRHATSLSVHVRGCEL